MIGGSNSLRIMFHSSLRRAIRQTTRGPSVGNAFKVRTLATTPSDLSPALTTTTIPPLEWSSHPFDGVCHAIEYIHTVTEVPYFGAIMLCTVAVRTILLPLTVKVLRNGAKMQIAAPEIEKFKKLLEESKNGTDEERKKIMTDMMAVYAKHDVNPLRSIMLPFFQMPIFISMFFGIQRMGDYFPGFATGGYGSFENLATNDPTYVLPVINAVSFLLVSETNSEIDASEHGPVMRNVFRAMAVAMPFVTFAFPKGAFVYWVTNNCYSMAQGALLRSPAIKSALNIPVIPKKSNK